MGNTVGLVSVFGAVVLAAGGVSPEVRACRSAASASTSEHLKVCTRLLKDPACRAAALAPDGGPEHLSTVVDACVGAYCPRMSQPVAACTGVRGTPAEGYGVEFEFLGAAFALDHGSEWQPAFRAWADAQARAANERSAARRASDEAFKRRTRLVLDLEGDRQTVVVRNLSSRPTDSEVWSLGSQTDQDCRAFVMRSSDGGTFPRGAAVQLTATKQVPFKAIRCLMSALVDAGVAREDIQFRTREHGESPRAP